MSVVASPAREPSSSPDEEIKRHAETARRARIFHSAVDYTLVILGCIATATGSILAAIAAIAKSPENLRMSWPALCAAVAVVTGVGTIFNALHGALGSAAKRVEAKRCSASLKGILIRLPDLQPKEARSRLAEVVEQHPETFG